MISNSFSLTGQWNQKSSKRGNKWFLQDKNKDIGLKIHGNQVKQLWLFQRVKPLSCESNFLEKYELRQSFKKNLPVLLLIGEHCRPLVVQRQ